MLHNNLCYILQKCLNGSKLQKRSNLPYFLMRSGNMWFCTRQLNYQLNKLRYYYWYVLNVPADSVNFRSLGLLDVAVVNWKLKCTRFSVNGIIFLYIVMNFITLFSNFQWFFSHFSCKSSKRNLVWKEQFEYTLSNYKCTTYFLVLILTFLNLYFPLWISLLPR